MYKMTRRKLRNINTLIAASFLLYFVIACFNACSPQRISLPSKPSSNSRIVTNITSALILERSLSDVIDDTDGVMRYAENYFK